MNELRLIAHEGKHGIIYWQAADRQQVNAALRALFDMLDEQGCYEDDEGLDAARAGEHSAIYRILKARQDCEYEKWEVIYAIDPSSK